MDHGFKSKVESKLQKSQKSYRRPKPDPKAISRKLLKPVKVDLGSVTLSLTFQMFPASANKAP
jgi:hypothetical protein